ncbi:GNAT family N-acetyltransferase [Actinacidiphila glaucinigra]|uniref:GNAT family N-acetyltransferase n=1 Tax=Actinacidiphila glaucinigra TaxID=235986 RepID=UPI0036ED60D0
MHVFPQPVLRTSRLLLRPFSEDDVDDVRLACDDEATQRWLPLPRPYTREAAAWWCREGAAQALRSGDGVQFAAEELDGGRLVGAFGLKSTDWRDGRTEVGYWVGPWARGRGLAPEALRAVCVWALRETPVRRISLLAATGNTASQRVAAKAGFVREGVLRGAGHTHTGRVDCVVYGLVPEDLPAAPEATP